MNKKYKKIYCCTTRSFPANEHFFIRDTGLISSTIREVFHLESKCIMPLPYHDSDMPEHVIRTEYKNLTSVTWWKSLGIDALVLYSWGAPRYLPVARAVHKAGIRLIIHMDTTGRFKNVDWDSWAFFARLVQYIRLSVHTVLRSIHLNYADIITINKPAAELMMKSFFYRIVAKKKFIMPAPVSPHFQLLIGKQRQRKIVFVGRWSDSAMDKVKRPDFMINTVREILTADSSVVVDIIGKLGDAVLAVYSKFSKSMRSRVNLIGYVFNKDLPKIYNEAQVSVCTSYSESTHIASAEALCCGCSLVIPPRETLHVLHWYTGHESGRIAGEDTPKSVAQACLKELEMWEKKERNPQEIARYWQPYFHIDKVLDKIFQ